MNSEQMKKVKLEKKNLKIALCFEIIFLFFVDCEQSLFSQSSLSSAGLERAKRPRGKLELPLGFLFCFLFSLASLDFLARVTILRDCSQSIFFVE